MANQSTWIPEHLRGTDWYIFQRLYQCKVKNIDSMSVDYIKQFGSPASGDPLLDLETANELVTRMLSINQMVEYFEAGVTVHVVNIADTKDIYDKITDHLNAWKHKLTNDFHNRAAPIDDLLLLDKFANVVYRHAVPYFKTEEVDSLVSRRSAEIMRVNRQNILNKPTTTTINAAVEKEIPARPSMSETFSQHQLPAQNLSKSWR